MTDFVADSQPEASLLITVTRADGTVEDLGCVSQWVPTEDEIAFFKNATRKPRRSALLNLLKGNRK